jgi:ABC-type Fe3+/spermidine/putrescine transport system ATPase subunit
MSVSPDRNLKEAAPAPPPLGAGAATDRVEAAPTDAPILSVNNIEVVYDHVILVLKGVSLKVAKGEIVALLGANGAGKSTTLKAISNLLSAERGEVTKGSIVFDGEEVHARSPNELVRRGCIQVMEGRHCFAHLSVEENLFTGAFTRPRSRLFLLPAAEGAPQLHRRIYLGRRAADVRDRTRADVAAEDDPAGRTFDGARAAAGRGDFRDRRRSQR